MSLHVIFLEISLISSFRSFLFYASGEDNCFFFVKPCVLILVNFTISYPYDNSTVDGIHNCSSPMIDDLKPLYQANYANLSYCEGVSQKVLPNCSVVCSGNTCSINARCVNEIEPRCLIPKYMDMYIRMIYECVHHSSKYIILFSSFYCYLFFRI